MPAQTKPITVFLLDDHPMMRFGLAELINREVDMEVVGEAGSSEEALMRLPALKPQICILDVSLPDRNGLSILKEIEAIKPRPKALIISMHDEMVYAERALRAGAHGYIMKENAAENVIEGIRRIATGNTYVSEAISNHLARIIAGDVERCSIHSVDNLTDRQLEIWEHIGNGTAIKDVGGKLGISVKTVEAHCARIKDKLNFPNGRAMNHAAVIWVNEQGQRGGS